MVRRDEGRAWGPEDKARCPVGFLRQGSSQYRQWKILVGVHSLLVDWVVCRQSGRALVDSGKIQEGIAEWDPGFPRAF